MRSVCNYYCYKNIREKNQINKLKPDKIELTVFDMDGVLTDIISSWKYIHDYFKTSNETSVDDYLKGHIDDLEFLKRDVALWKENGKSITIEKLSEILSDIPLMKGAKETISTLKNHGIKTGIISAGLNILANQISQELEIDNIIANRIKVDKDGRLIENGIIGVKLIYKDQVVQTLAKKLDIPLNKVVAVGNSCFDIPMFEISGLGIAFNPEDDCVRKAADFVVEEKDLTGIIPYIEQYL